MSAEEAAAARPLWALTFRGASLEGPLGLPCAEALTVRVREGGAVTVSLEGSLGSAWLGGTPLLVWEARPWPEGEALVVRMSGEEACVLTRGPVVVEVAGGEAGPEVEVALEEAPEQPEGAWFAHALARVRLGALRGDGFMRRMMGVCLGREGGRWAWLEALRREASGLGEAWRVPVDVGREVPAAQDVVTRWVDAWLADRRALAVSGEPPPLLLGCAVKAWLLDRGAAAPQPIYPLHDTDWITLGAEGAAAEEGLRVEPALRRSSPPHVLEWRWDSARQAGTIAARRRDGGSEARDLCDGDRVELRDGGGRRREVRFRTGEVVALRGWGAGGARVSVAFEGPEMTLGGEGADVVLEGVGEARCAVRRFAPPGDAGGEAPVSAGRFEVEVWGEGRLKREVRVMGWAGQGRDVWSVGPWRFALERWPQSEQGGDSASLGVNAALTLLRELLARGEETEAAWSEVMWQAGVCRATGAGEVAGAYLDAHLARWPERFAAPRCPCGRWSRWVAHHIPGEAEARRAALRRCAGFAMQGQPCLPRFSLCASDAGDARGGAVPLRCALWMGVGAGGALWTALDGAQARGEAQWRYAWSEDEGEGVLARFEGARAALACDGQEAERVVLRAGQRVTLGERVWEVRRGAWPLRVRVTPRGEPPRELVFAQAAVNVGRGERNDVVLPEGSVSKRHCRIVYWDGAWVAVDQGPSGGIYINGSQPRGPHALRGGDRLLVGGFVLEFPDVV